MSKTEKKKPGREATRPIHPSWLPYLQYFDPENPSESQRGFLRHCESFVKGAPTPATLSTMKTKKMPYFLELAIVVWGNIRP